MIRLQKEKLTSDTFACLGTLIIDDSRGPIVAGASHRSSNRGRIRERYEKYALISQDGVVPHPPFSLGFAIIGGQIVWAESEQHSDSIFVCREDGLRHRAWYLHGYKNYSDRLVFVALDEKNEKKIQYLWVDGETGPELDTIHNLQEIDGQIAYTGFDIKEGGGFYPMLDNERVSLPEHRLADKLFKHNGKFGYVVVAFLEGKIEVQRIWYDGDWFSDPTKQIWAARSINGRLIHVGQTGSIFQSGTIEGGMLDGMPSFDLTEGFGHPIHVDGENIAFAQSWSVIPFGDKGVAFNLAHSKSLRDKEWTEILVCEDDIRRFEYRDGRGYIFDIGGQLAFVQSYGDGRPVLSVNGELVTNDFHDISSGFDALVDVDGKVGATVRKEKGDGQLFPMVDGVVSGEAIPIDHDLTTTSPKGAFGSNPVIVASNYYGSGMHLSVAGKTYGSYVAVSEVCFSEDALRCVVSDEEGTFLLTFTDQQ